MYPRRVAPALHHQPMSAITGDSADRSLDPGLFAAAPRVVYKKDSMTTGKPPEGGMPLVTITIIEDDPTRRQGALACAHHRFYSRLR